MNQTRRLMLSEDGGSAMEYAFLASLIAMAIIGTLADVGQGIVAQLFLAVDAMN